MVPVTGRPGASRLATSPAPTGSDTMASTAGTRTLPLQDFVLGPRQTARRPDEMVTALLVPDRVARSVFHKLGARRYLVISITMAAVTLGQHADGRISHARVAVGSCGPRAVRLPALEAALLGAHPHPGLVQPPHLQPLSPIDDVRGPASYRLDATLELLRRAVDGFSARAAAA